MIPPACHWQTGVANAHQRLRDRAPLVHCLTNQVTMNFVANTLLAAGASPAMTDHPDEAGELAGAADALLINLGTPGEASLTAMHRAALAAHAAGTPWVLDPVGAAALPLRRDVALTLRAQRPAVIRGNASEILALEDGETRGRGVDTRHRSEAGLAAAASLLDHADGIAISGEVDHLATTDDSGQPQRLRIAGGSAWQPRVTGTGCALGALIAAYLAVAESVMEAMLAAHLHVAAAAEQAERTAAGPGSFAVAWLDALDQVAPGSFTEERVTRLC
ncbi:hydroxyethylthiazole kinase [Salinicola avicenniae]|uniref:hydroxyethylthiazole kinase n=1 Tax=Salinicola avicenniae TaxID=2916836 RepID=UPI002074A6C0|nr:hydroxyethylthiazole kinase [Salinicola sp. S1-1-8]